MANTFSLNIQVYSDYFVPLYNASKRHRLTKKNNEKEEIDSKYNICPLSGQSLTYYMSQALNGKGLWLTTYGTSYIIFSVQACRDAFIYLSEVK